MTRIMLLTTAIAVGLTATSAAALGGRDGRMDPPSFAELDANGDGKVTTEEFEAFAQTKRADRFKATDTDGDGNLSQEEIAAAAQNAKAGRMADRAERMVSRLDKDGDGMVSEEEMTAAMGDKRGNRGGEPGERFLERFDTDKDGAISEEEFAAAEEFKQMNGDRGKMKRGGKGGHGKRDGGPIWRN